MPHNRVRMPLGRVDALSLPECGELTGNPVLRVREVSRDVAIILRDFSKGRAVLRSAKKALSFLLMAACLPPSFATAVPLETYCAIRRTDDRSVDLYNQAVQTVKTDMANFWASRAEDPHLSKAERKASETIFKLTIEPAFEDLEKKEVDFSARAACRQAHGHDPLAKRELEDVIREVIARKINRARE